MKAVTIEGVSGKFDFAQHFKISSAVVRDEAHKAYIVIHGLCSHFHNDVVLKISAPEFESTETQIAFRGDRAYVINLKRKGSKEKATISETRCEQQPDRCIEKVPLNLKR